MRGRGVLPPTPHLSDALYDEHLVYQQKPHNIPVCLFMELDSSHQVTT